MVLTLKEIQIFLPQILYNVPGRTVCDMLPETVKRLYEVDNIIPLFGRMTIFTACIWVVFATNMFFVNICMTIATFLSLLLSIL